MRITCPAERRKLFAFCRREINHLARELGGKAHLIYLGAATVMDTSIIIRVCTGSCLVFCLIVEIVKVEENN